MVLVVASVIEHVVVVLGEVFEADVEVEVVVRYVKSRGWSKCRVRVSGDVTWNGRTSEVVCV